MAAIYVVVKFPKVTGIPEDSIINTFSFDTGIGIPIDTNAIDDVDVMMSTFYTLPVAPSVNAISAYMSSEISRAANAVLVQIYDATAGSGTPGLGLPVAERHFTAVAPASAGNYPTEAAVCLSFHANSAGVPEHAPGGSRPRARYRGRIYLGPLNVAAGGQDGASQKLLVATTLRTDLCAAANRLMLDGASKQTRWSVWSRTDAQLRLVVGGHVDDAFDTQRRRGFAPEVRTTFGALAGRAVLEATPDGSATQ